MSNSTSSLNQQQQEAATHTQGASVILAGAGSGKTRVLVTKVLHLIQRENVSPQAILMITFTNKAAGEMKQRMGAVKLGFVGTFHSFCARALRIDGEHVGLDPRFVIYDTDDQTALMKRILKDVPTKFSPSYFLNRISAAKNELISADAYLSVFKDYQSQLVSEIYIEYQKRLQKNKAIDFDDLLMKAYELLKNNEEIRTKYQTRYQHILVDEFQDTNSAQYALTKILSLAHQNITVVGDFSQSIYSWRGADIRNLERFSKDFPESKTYYLERNYRSTQAILSFAFGVIKENTTHPILELHTQGNDGDEVTIHEAFDEQDEVRYIIDEIHKRSYDRDGESYAALYRTNAQSRVLEEALLHEGLPYVLVGGQRFYERKEVKDVLCYLRLLVNPLEEIALARAKKIGKRRYQAFANMYTEIAGQKDELTTGQLMERVFDATQYLSLYDPHSEEDYGRLENIRELKSVADRFPKLDEFLEQIALVESEYSEDEKHKKHTVNITLMTLHQAKGLEFDVVFIMGLEEGVLPHSRSLDDQHSLEEERRLFYVGITRARHLLYITHARKRFLFGRRSFGIKSRFLLEEGSDPTDRW